MERNYKVVFSFEYQRGNMSYSIIEPELYAKMIEKEMDFQGFLFARNNNSEVPLNVSVDLYLNPQTQVMEVSRFTGEKMLTEMIMGQKLFTISTY